MDDRTYNLWQCVVEVADPEGKTFWHPQVRRGVTGDIAVRRAVDDVQYIGMPAYRFQPWWFGPYSKQTQLWGDFNTNLQRTPVEPVKGSWMYNNVNGAHNRAITPAGFAQAFFEANP